MPSSRGSYSAGGSLTMASQKCQSSGHLNEGVKVDRFLT